MDVITKTKYYVFKNNLSALDCMQKILRLFVKFIKQISDATKKDYAFYLDNCCGTPQYLATLCILINFCEFFNIVYQPLPKPLPARHLQDLIGMESSLQ